MELFDFNKELWPVYLWASGGLLLCIFAICKIKRFEKMHSEELSQKVSSEWREYNALQQRLLTGVIFYLFCAIPLIGFMTSSVSLCIYGGILFILFLAVSSNLSKK